MSSEPKHLTLTVEPRTKVGGRSGLNSRLNGRIPAIIYGLKQDPVPVSIERTHLLNTLKTRERLLQIDNAGNRELVLLKDVQYDHLGSEVIHVDFTRVDLNKPVRVQLNLELVGRPAGLAEGGVLEQGLAQIEVECLPLNIPRQSFKVDVSPMKLDAVLHVRDLKLPPELSAATSPEAVIATVHLPSVKPDASPGEGPTAPEVIKRKTEAGEDAAAATPTAGKEAKKPEAKKPEAKKPEAKKPEAKKPEAKKK